ncbi:MAG: addiction module toxin RelE [Cyanobacteria bacterium RYN_339]|nr:addiction module toxin RelE [Cyanobacteria bacterium RYN_339]
MTKNVRWTPGTKKKLRELEEDVRAGFGYGLYLVQEGKETAEIEEAVDGLKVKQLAGYGALVYELKQNHNKDTYRCMYTVRLRGAVYVLHAFKKKSKSGIGLPKDDDNLIREHLKWAEVHYRQNPVEENDDGNQD